MPRFKFRAQAALDLRVREHDAALRELARVESERQRAQARLEAAEVTLTEAKRTADDAVRTATSTADLQWYRIWIVRLGHERNTVAAALVEHDKAVTLARSAAMVARQRRESLERFRDKALATHLAGEAAEEMKMLDELATRRFAVRPTG